MSSSKCCFVRKSSFCEQEPLLSKTGTIYLLSDTYCALVILDLLSTSGCPPARSTIRQFVKTYYILAVGHLLRFGHFRPLASGIDIVKTGFFG